MTRILTIVPRLLRDPDAFYQSIERGEGVGSKAYDLALSSILFLIVFGLVTGLAHSPLQALSSAVKMPLLFLITMVFCVPALYFFSLALLGTSLSLMKIITVILSGIGVTAFLLLGLSPITLFFDLTSSSYAFFRLLEVLFVAICASIGFYYIWRGISRVDSDEKLTMGNVGRALLGAWILLYGFVGAQMAWRLSPLIGNPDSPFVMFRPSRDNFFIDVIHAFEEATGQAPLRPLGSALSLSCTVWLLIIALGLGVFLGSRRRGVSSRSRSMDARQADLIDSANAPAAENPTP